MAPVERAHAARIIALVISLGLVLQFLHLVIQEMEPEMKAGFALETQSVRRSAATDSLTTVTLLQPRHPV